MSDAGTIIESALKGIMVQGAELTLEADEYADAIMHLNNMMFAYEANGIRLGYTEVDNVSDEVTVPKGARFGVIANLSIALADAYGATVSPSTQRSAEIGLRAMRNLGRPRIKMAYPATLPCGSGNYDYNTREYYSGSSSAVLGLSGNTESIAFTAADTPVRIKGYWTAESLGDLRADITGTVTNIGDLAQSALCNATIKATGGAACTFRLMLNGVSQASSTATLSASEATVTISKTVTLQPGDYVELWVENDDDTTAVVVTTAQFTVT